MTTIAFFRIAAVLAFGALCLQAGAGTALPLKPVSYTHLTLPTKA